MKVYVVVADCGLNGSYCAGVYTDERTALDLIKDRRHGYTGWSGYSVEEMVVDAPMSEDS
jgi:hypothetical protein